VRILGLDPGSRTGLAVWDRTDQKLLDIRTVAKAKAFDEALRLAREHAVDIILVEQNKDTVYNRPGQNPRAMLRIAKNVGQNIAFAEDLARRLRAEGFTVELVPPIRRGTKWSRETWEAHMGYSGRSSSHSRDASILARHHEKEAK